MTGLAQVPDERTKIETRSIDTIARKIAKGSARIYTAAEICAKELSGNPVKFEDVDAVTTATKGLMSGTFAELCFRFSESKRYPKVKSLFLNGIPAYPGPAPNEYLGVVDCIVLGTEHSVDNPEYGGGHLFRDIVENKAISVKGQANSGELFTCTVQKGDFSSALLIGMRHAFRNYRAFINPDKNTVPTIFSVNGLHPENSESTVCGTGCVNPLHWDPENEILGIGSAVWINGAPGIITSPGTRATADNPNIMTSASLLNMIPEFMGGFRTSVGPEVICTVGAVIPIISEKQWISIAKTDDRIKLPIVDVKGRSEMGNTDYGSVWTGTDHEIKYIPERCKNCHEIDCSVEKYCPTGCFTHNGGINRQFCVNCGHCVHICPEGAFFGNLGKFRLNEMDIPITLRQSDRFGAVNAMNRLKQAVIAGKFPLKSRLYPLFAEYDSDTDSSKTKPI